MVGASAMACSRVSPLPVVVMLSTNNSNTCSATQLVLMAARELNEILIILLRHSLVKLQPTSLKIFHKVVSNFFRFRIHLIEEVKPWESSINSTSRSFSWSKLKMIRHA